MFFGSMDLRFTGVPLKVGISLAKCDVLAILCVTLVVTLDFWQTIVTHRNTNKSIVANQMPPFNGTPVNLRSIVTKNLRHPPTKSKY